ncbi:MAG: S-methyl-5-thioribose-1-phosphate isomerase [Magnetococcales bacterium]|nr:S-methyl-5-thioribose-1-phosphate isomerase [Magnetococcales bacterium]
MKAFDTAVWEQGRVRMLDQRLLPQREVHLTFGSAAEVADGIRDMVVRGAPAIGCAAAYGVAVEALRLATAGIPPTAESMAPGLDLLRKSRPTAVNLAWALDRMAPLIAAGDPPTLPQRLLEEAHRIREEDFAACRAMGFHGAALLPDVGDRTLTIMTHCNAGALATGGYFGTALGVIRAAGESGRRLRVIANETRPYLQGARLTAWELMRDGFDVTLVTDNMVGHLMKHGEVDAVVVGADRIAANGDAANKIGTYTVAVLAQRHGLPFFVAAPLSTIDRATPTGAHIPIEERSAEEITVIAGQRIAPEGVKVRYPAFDVTPAELITAIVTEAGAAFPPNVATIARLFGD